VISGFNMGTPSYREFFKHCMVPEIMVEIIYRRSDLKRALLLASIVGSWLVSFNQGSAILAGTFGALLYLRILLDYLTPFTVSSVTAILRNWSDRKKGIAVP
jgi:hypothetical protein